jgi:diacylglycerol kinase family enzyme
MCDKLAGMFAERTDTASNAGASAGGPELFVVINPGSGEHDATQTRETLTRVFEAEGRRFQFVRIDKPAFLADASNQAAATVKRCNGILVAVGGDGTINTVAQAAWREACTLGVLPQGTFNLFARNHGIAQDLETAARALLHAEPGPVQVGEVNGRLFLVNASVGLYPQVLQDREYYKKQLGRHRWVAVISGLITLFEWRRQLALEIGLDGESARVTTPTLFIGNNRLQFDRIGIEPEVAEKVGQGRLGGVIAKPIGNWALLGLVLRGAFGRLGEAEQVQSFAFRTLDVRVIGMRKMKVAVDGEVGVMRPPLRFAVAQQPLTLMLPRPQDRVAVE